MVDENKKFNVNFTKSGLSDYILQEILKKSSIEDGLSELQKTNKQIKDRINKVVKELENNKEIADSVNKAIEDIQVKTFGDYEALKNHFNVTGKNYRKLLVEIKKSLGSKELSKIKASAAGYQASSSAFATKVEKAYEDYQEQLRKLEEENKRLEEEAKKQAEEEAKRAQQRAQQAKQQAQQRAKQAQQLAKQRAKQRQQAQQLQAKQKALKAAYKQQRIKDIEDNFSDILLAYPEKLSKTKGISLDSVKEYQEEVAQIIANANAGEKNEANLIQAKKDIRNTFIKYRTAQKAKRKTFFGSPFFDPLYANYSVDPQTLGNVVNNTKPNITAGAPLGSATNPYSGINGTAGTGPASQTNIINSLPSAQQNTKAPTAPKGNKGSMGNMTTTSSSFAAQQQKAEEKQKQKGFLALLIPELQKILKKSPFGDLLRLLFLILGKKHPVAAATGLAIGVPAIVGLLANMLLGNPLGKMGGALFGKLGMRNLFRGNKFFQGLRVNGLFGSLGNLGKSGIGNFVTKTGTALANMLRGLGGSFKSLGNIFKNFPWGNILKGIGNGFKGAWTGIKGFFGGIKTAVPNLLKGMGNGLKVFGKGFMSKLPLIGSIFTALEDIPDIKRAAKNGKLGGQLLKTGSKAVGSAIGTIAGGMIGGVPGAFIGGWLGKQLGSALGDVMRGFTDVAGKALPRLINAFGKLGSALGPLFSKISSKIGKLLSALGFKTFKVTGFFEALGRTIGNVINVLAEWIEKLSLFINKGEIKEKEKAINNLADPNSSEYKALADKYRDEKVQAILQKKHDNGEMDAQTKSDFEAGKIKMSWLGNNDYWNKVYNENKADIENYANRKIKNDKKYIENKKAELEGTAVTTSDNISELKYGNAAEGLKRYNVNGKTVVAMKDLGLHGSIWSNNSKPYVPLENVARVKALDEWSNKKGYQAVYTSNMGGHDVNSGHGQGRKLDVQFSKNGKQVRLSSKDEAELKAMGYFDGVHSLGWEAQKNKKGEVTGHHYDLSIASKSDLNKSIATSTGTTTSGSSSAGAGYNVVSESDVWNAVKAHTAGSTNSHTDNVRNLIFSATDVTGSLGVFGITQWNNTGHKKGA